MQNDLTYPFAPRIPRVRQKLSRFFGVVGEGVQLRSVPNGAGSNSRPAFYLEYIGTTIELVSNELLVNRIMQGMSELLLITRQTFIRPTPYKRYPYIGAFLAKYHTSASGFHLLPRYQADRGDVRISRLYGCYPGSFFRHQVESQPM